MGTERIQQTQDKKNEVIQKELQISSSPSHHNHTTIVRYLVSFKKDLSYG